MSNPFVDSGYWADGYVSDGDTVGNFTFDGPGRLIVVNAGVTSISVRDLWSRWLDWLAIDTNGKWPFAFEKIGGEYIDPAAGTRIPTYLYLLNGWRLRPQEANHTLTVTAGILTVSGGGDPFVNTLGNYVVRINYEKPVQAIVVETGGGGGGGLTVDQAATLQLISDRLLDLYKVHGLLAGTPLVVSETQRSAGSLVQSITESGGATTVERV